MHFEDLRHVFWGSFLFGAVFSDFRRLLSGLWFLFGFCGIFVFAFCIRGLFSFTSAFPPARSICFRARFGVTKSVTDRVF